MRLQFQSLLATGRIEKMERRGRTEKFFPAQKEWSKTNPAFLHEHAQLAPTTKNVLLDLAGQSRLARPGMRGRVRIRVHRKRAVNLRRFVVADARPDVVVA